jgi:hypothetical protein
VSGLDSDARNVIERSSVGILLFRYFGNPYNKHRPACGAMWSAWIMHKVTLHVNE